MFALKNFVYNTRFRDSFTRAGLFSTNTWLNTQEKNLFWEVFNRSKILSCWAKMFLTWFYARVELGSRVFFRFGIFSPVRRINSKFLWKTFAKTINSWKFVKEFRYVNCPQFLCLKKENHSICQKRKIAGVASEKTFLSCLTLQNKKQKMSKKNIVSAASEKSF